MEPKAALKAFSQAEKIKAGIIWSSQSLGALAGMAPMERKGAQAALRMVVGMIGQEVHLAWKATGDATWMNTEKNIDMALVMIDSGVAEEAVFHLTRALRQVTNKARQAMKVLVHHGWI